MRLLIALAVVILWVTPAQSERFVSIAFHEVLDDERELGSNDIATARLIAFLDWLKGSGWTAISLDDVAAAERGQKKLPERAILLSFDDGYASIYKRVYPLLLAYRMPAVFALVGAWMDTPPAAMVRYGDVDVPRGKFVTWDQAREMARSGLAEFASHSYGLHRGELGNPSGSKFPSAAARIYDTQTDRIETDNAVRARVRADLERSRRLMQTQLGVAPRTLVWPFGRYSGPAQAAARDVGFSFVLTLEPEPADTQHPLAISRYYPSRDPILGPLAEGLRFSDPAPTVRRVACLDAGPLADDTTLGHTIEALRRLGANTVVLGSARSASAADRSALSFAAWQIRSRAGVALFLRADAASTDVAAVQDLVRVAPVDGLLLDNAGNLTATSTARVAPFKWTIRAARDALEPRDLDAAGQHALVLWRAAEALRPSLRLALSVSSDAADYTAHAGETRRFPSPAADWLLLPGAQDGLPTLAAAFAARGWLAPDIGPRLTLPAVADDRGAVALRAAQAMGATAFAECPATLPATAAFVATFSAAGFPRLP